MKFITLSPVTDMITIYSPTIIKAILLTLIVLPMSVLAQVGTENVDTNEVSEISVAADSIIVPEQTDLYYDNYKREDLPEASNEFGDFVVGPGRFGLEIAPGESKTVILNISNRLGERRLFRFTTEDITSQSADSVATVKLLGDQIGPYTIKDYISVPYESFYLDTNQRAVIPVTISIPSDAEPGGFYGSILTEVLPAPATENTSAVKPSAPVISRIGTLFFVTTPGDIEREGSLVDFTTIPKKSFYLEGPIDAGIIYENTGSVHVTPDSQITITNIMGETVGEIELLPWFVMPSSVRTREFSWDREFLIGRYKMTAVVNRGYDNLVDQQSFVFWVFPWKTLVPVFAGVFVFFLALRFVLRNFEFKRK